MRIRKIIFAIGLGLMTGCATEGKNIAMAQNHLSTITDHAKAALVEMKPDTNRPNIKRAYEDVSAIPPEAAAASQDIDSLQKNYDQLDNKWYVKLGRKLEAIFWTLIICGIVGGLALGAINFYTGGLVGSTFIEVVFGALKLFFQNPIAYIHNSIAALVTKVQTRKAITNTVQAVTAPIAPTAPAVAPVAVVPVVAPVTMIGG
jgi:uncharacterized membrane protein YjjP (DUF1212 family)